MNVFERTELKYLRLATLMILFMSFLHQVDKYFMQGGDFGFKGLDTNAARRRMLFSLTLSSILFRLFLVGESRTAVSPEYASVPKGSGIYQR